MTGCKPIVFSFLAVLLLAACAGMTTFDQSLRALEGRPVNDAKIMLKGEPSGQYTDGQGRLVYVWKGYQRESIFGPAVTKGRGYDIMNTGIYWTGIEHHRCTVRAATTGGIVQKITFEGNPGGCETIYGSRREELGYNSSQRP